MTTPSVFISYSHDSPEHADRVLELSNRLRTDGINATIDQYELSPPEGWPRWMHRHIRAADFVLMVCTETYFSRVMGEEKPGTGLGVKWEGNLIYQHIYDADTTNTRFIPVLFKDFQVQHIPTPLQGATYYRVDTADGYEELYRRITDQPRIKKPTLGKPRRLPARERKRVFFPPTVRKGEEETEPKAFARLTQEWSLLKDAGDVNRRGFEFEFWLRELLIAHGFQVHGSFRRKDPQEQIDAALYYGFTTFLIEAKWLSQPVDGSHIDRFAGRLKRSPAGTYGLFFSVSGFNESATKIAESWLSTRPIYLVDKAHVLSLLQREIRGDTWLKLFDFIARRRARAYIPIEEIKTELPSVLREPATSTLPDRSELSKLRELPKRERMRELFELKISLAKLPSTSPDLFGRENELKTLDDAWDNPQFNVLSLVAWGGVGKSALVNKWLTQMSADNYRGAECVFGSSFYSQGAAEGRQVSADQFIAAALEWFGDSEMAKSNASPWDKGERLAELVKQQRTLLILDGLEPLQNPPPVETGKIKDPGLTSLLRELARQNPGLLVITTRLAVDDLKDFKGSTAIEIDLENLSSEAGAAYLKHLGVDGTDNELKDASRDFGGHALALTLMGSYLKVVHRGDVRKRKEIPRLTDEQKQGAHARRVMESYERWLKDKPELDILRLMGLFDRPAERGAMDALRKKPAIKNLTSKLQRLSSTDWQFAINNLRDLRLIAPADAEAPDTLDCHPLLREHFGEKLKASNPNAWCEAHSRLYEYYKSAAKEFPDTIEEMAPLYAAVMHGCQAGKHQQALDDVFFKRMDRAEAFVAKKLGAMGSTLTALSGLFDPPWRKPVDGLREADKGYILNNAGFCLRALGRLAEAAQPMQAGLDAAIAQKDWRNAAQAATNLSELYLTIGDLTQARAYAKQSVELADRSGEAPSQVRGHGILATALHQAGNFDEAESAFHKSETIQKATEPESPFLYSFGGYLYCDLLLSQGNYGEVQRRASQTVQFAKHGWYSLLSIALDNLSLGRAHLLQSQLEHNHPFTESANYLNRAVDGLRQAGQQDFIARGLLARAELYRVTGALEKAQQDLDEAFTIATRSGMGLHLADCHLEYARLWFARGEKEKAREHLSIAKEMIEKMGYHRRDREVKELEGRL